jgi:4-hydroxybenzoate polyprenyltransferase
MKAILGGLFQLARPKDWIKNLFVVVPVPFAIRAGSRFELYPFVCGLCGFCLVNSAVYTFNDLLDATADRLHPQKRNRPLAAGTVPLKAAVMQIAVLLLAGMGLCLATGKPAAVTIALLYVLINVVYCLGAKHLALLDVFFLSSGFVIRVLLGCALVTAAPSAWLLLCTSALSLFLGFAKRRADLGAGVDSNHRPSLRNYSQSFLDHAMTICAGVALLSYALYSIESKVLWPGREMASMPFVAYGILDYLRLADTENAGGSPVEIAFTSRSSQICAVGWAVAVTWSLGLW